jgi:hypothetical protein
VSGKTIHAQLAHEEARRTHGPSYSKAQLVAAGKRVLGGFASDPHKPIRSQDDTDNARTAMALIDGHYPASMSDCETVGLSGGCGTDCPVFVRGECEVEGEVGEVGS